MNKDPRDTRVYRIELERLERRQRNEAAAAYRDRAIQAGRVDFAKRKQTIAEIVTTRRAAATPHPVLSPAKPLATALREAEKRAQLKRDLVALQAAERNPSPAHLRAEARRKEVREVNALVALAIEAGRWAGVAK